MDALDTYAASILAGGPADHPSPEDDTYASGLRRARLGLNPVTDPSYTATELAAYDRGQLDGRNAAGLVPNPRERHREPPRDHPGRAGIDPRSAR